MHAAHASPVVRRSHLFIYWITCPRSISLAVLMVEATGSLRPMFGIIVAVVVSNLVAIVFGTQGVYESELEAQLQVNYLAQVYIVLL